MSVDLNEPIKPKTRFLNRVNIYKKSVTDGQHTNYEVIIDYLKSRITDSSFDVNEKLKNTSVFLTKNLKLHGSLIDNLSNYLLNSKYVYKAIDKILLKDFSIFLLHDIETIYDKLNKHRPYSNSKNNKYKLLQASVRETAIRSTLNIAKKDIHLLIKYEVINDTVINIIKHLQFITGMINDYLENKSTKKGKGTAFGGTRKKN